MSKVRGIRFTVDEEAQIYEFLRKNPLIDFSMMAKVAILEFIRHPQINLEPIATKRKGFKDVSATN